MGGLGLTCSERWDVDRLAQARCCLSMFATDPPNVLQRRRRSPRHVPRQNDPRLTVFFPRDADARPSRAILSLYTTPLHGPVKSQEDERACNHRGQPMHPGTHSRPGPRLATSISRMNELYGIRTASTHHDPKTRVHGNRRFPLGNDSAGHDSLRDEMGSGEAEPGCGPNERGCSKKAEYGARTTSAQSQLADAWKELRGVYLRVWP
ncbi:hypothetical protein DFP72DRAFT_163851 [Ephemerocybe angulata]|uniref:Uncharacterized protein n=1 Tax=Ephemerocybe angulata TaxID=980116 RepID=A0A8H6I5C4_9AGAR|nr:hypothetical protein DFP72DRAFT_163851 [Tulosesus angulatus]